MHKFTLPLLVSSLYLSPVCAQQEQQDLGAPAFGPKPEAAGPELSSFATVGSPAIPYHHGDPTDLEQYMLELVNQARLDPLGEVARNPDVNDLNQGLGLDTPYPGEFISAEPKQPLAFNPMLIDAAVDHSQWMLDYDIFSHTGAGGSGPGERMAAAGYLFTGSWTWGENIAWQGSTGPIDEEAWTLSEHQGLFHSPGHRLNVMNPAFREIGVGSLTGLFSTVSTTYNALMTTQDFAVSSGSPSPGDAGPFLLGVVYEDLDDNGFYSPGEGLSDVTVMPPTGDYYTVTSASGGYAIPLAALGGEMEIRASGGALEGNYGAVVEVNGQNVKADFVKGEGWRFITNFGWVETSTLPWVYHQDIGWLWVQHPDLENSTSLLLWRLSDSSLYWSAAGIYPWAYNLNTRGWSQIAFSPDLSPEASTSLAADSQDPAFGKTP